MYFYLKFALENIFELQIMGSCKEVLPVRILLYRNNEIMDIIILIFICIILEQMIIKLYYVN